MSAVPETLRPLLMEQAEVVALLEQGFGKVLETLLPVCHPIADACEAQEEWWQVADRWANGTMDTVDGAHHVSGLLEQVQSYGRLRAILTAIGEIALEGDPSALGRLRELAGADGPLKDSGE